LLFFLHILVGLSHSQKFSIVYQMNFHTDKEYRIEEKDINTNK